jgi:hypothetical protein
VISRSPGDPGPSAPAGGTARRRPHERVSSCGREKAVAADWSDAGRKPRNTAEIPEFAALIAGVCPARDGGTGAPRSGIMWGFTEEDLSTRRRPPSSFEPKPPEARVLRVDCARRAETAAQRQPVDSVMHASLRHGLTHRCEDPPAASRHGHLHRVRLRGDRLWPIASGYGSRYLGAWRGCL